MDTPNTHRPRLIFLTQFYDPEPAYKGQAFAEAVRDLGYDVEVVTGFPNYPGGKVYEGYRIRPWHRSIQNGVRVTRLALYPSHSDSKLGRIANYLSFFMSAFLYLCLTARQASLVYVYKPPLTVGLAAAASRVVHRRPVIVDVHDLWPETLPATGMVSNPRILRWIDRAASWMYRKVQFIILHTIGFRETLLSKGVPADKMQSIIGWTNEYSLPTTRPDGLERLEAMPGLKLLYAGNIGPAQALDAVLDAAALLQQSGQVRMASFCFMGGGVSLEKLEIRASELNLNNVIFLPRVEPDKVGAFLEAADALLVHLRADPLFEITLPSKTQAYMYAGKPILMAVNGEATRLIQTANAGIIATPENPQSLANAVRALVELPSSERCRMGQSGREYYVRELSMDKGMKQFAEIFSRFGAQK
ncbi:glycosyltransferase family 4 protein [Sulfitobacter pontiacus]|uniref:glycosyltransferase family 4 protein n=1 Tax=Sulfitobacter pontiacus TaxID=60137 RepID=UPI0030EEC219